MYFFFFLLGPGSIGRFSESPDGVKEGKGKSNN